jgi:hypothetical protein
VITPTSADENPQPFERIVRVENFQPLQASQTSQTSLPHYYLIINFFTRTYK